MISIKHRGGICTLYRHQIRGIITNTSEYREWTKSGAYEDATMHTIEIFSSICPESPIFIKFDNIEDRDAAAEELHKCMTENR